MGRVLLLSLLCLPLLSAAQITLTRADFPKPSASSPLPDSVLFSNASGTSGIISHTLNGANMVWDESALTGNPAWQQFVPTSATPIIFQLVFLGSDYAQPLLNGGGVAGGTLTEAFEYYDYASSNSRLQVRGFGGNLLIPGQTIAVPLPANYLPDVIYTFPMQFGNEDSSLSGFNVTLPLGGVIGDVTIKRNQKRVNSVDGWGRITLPNGVTYDVLRQVSRITRVDSLITGLFPIGFPSRPVEYKWLAQGMKIPVLQVNGNLTGNGNNVNLTGATYIGGWPTNVEPMQTTMPNLLYPNPARDYVTCEFELNQASAVDILLYDAAGLVQAEFHLARLASGKYQEVIPLSGLANGHYVLVCRTERGVVAQKLLKY